LGFTARSGEIDPFQTYREELLTTPLRISLGGLVVGSISYHRSCEPAPPATACALQMASLDPCSGSAAATVCSSDPSSVSRRLELPHSGALGGMLKDGTGTVNGPVSLGPSTLDVTPYTVTKLEGVPLPTNAVPTSHPSA